MTKREVEEYIMSQIFPNASHEVTAQNVRNAFAPIVERVWTFLEGEIGDLTQLQTVDKQSVVNAINAVLSKMKTDIDKVNADIATLGANVGELSELETTEKTNLVKAVNEVKKTSFPDAPKDGKQYVRQNEAWAESEIKNISNEEATSSEEEEQIWCSDDETEVYVKIGHYGIKVKRILNMQGEDIIGQNDRRVISITEDEDITASLQELLDEGGMIRLTGEGTCYISSPLLISKNNTHIVIDDNVTVKIADSLIDSYQPNVNPIWMFYTPGSRYYWEDSRVGTEIVENISIEGGTLDFNGYRKNYMSSSVMPNRILAEFVGMSIVDVKNFKLKNTTLLGATSFCTMFAGLTNFHINDITIYTTGGSHDGLHFHGALNNGLIENIYGETSGDDIIGLNTGGDYWKGWMEHSNVVRKGHSNCIVIRNVFSSSNVRLLNGMTHRLSGIVLDNVKRIAISSYGEDAYYEDITIKNYNYISPTYYQSLRVLNFWNGTNSIGHKINIKKLSLDGMFVKNRRLFDLNNTHIDHLSLNGVEVVFSPHSWQVNNPNDSQYYIGELNNLVGTSNTSLMDDEFKDTGIMGTSSVDLISITNWNNNDGNVLKDKNDESYDRFSEIFDIERIDNIVISSSRMYCKNITEQESAKIAASSSIINNEIL